MEKKIEDYLHLYLGCEVMWGFDGRKKKGELVGKDEMYGWQVFDPSNAIVLYHPCRVELLKPILRPLSDMKDEEAVFYFSLPIDSKILKSNITKRFKSFEYRYINKKSELNNNDGYSYSEVALGLDGESLVGYPSKIIYLLSHHFDLFGLIESGLAIDKTTPTL